jgi:crossover junction endodeoxyribonuclease RusA
VRICIRVNGRPAPQGSKKQGGAGQLLEQSAYLPAWRAAVRIGAYRAYADAGIPGGDALPLFPAGVAVHVEQMTFLLDRSQCRVSGSDLPLGTPDLDKLLRSTLDALGGARRQTARVFADDSQVMRISNLSKQYPRLGDSPGAIIVISNEGAQP